MKKVTNLFLLLVLIVVIVSCGGQGAKENARKIEVVEVSVDSLLRDASKLEGQTVKFQAKVDHACMHGGKRLTVFGSIEGKTLKVDGTETSPRFASSLMDKTIEITGIVRKVPGSHVADCEVDEGNEIPDFAYTIECIDFKEI